MSEVVRFSFPTIILYGPGAVEQLPSCFEEVGIKKPLVVTDNGLPKTDAFARVAKVLKDSRVPHALAEDDGLLTEPAAAPAFVVWHPYTSKAFLQQPDRAPGLICRGTARHGRVRL